ncbi:autotransporter adhesin [Volucribacter psittacicida]|uniref:Autotransporter adhesin n=1 Tax=Volucribacter psittacicida TaxID=203482 RepID=A0A4R1G7G8_9PAST|nr:YadA-like family protein [Volucribacter psittacicida]TCK01579.1 autotransporter adhesin [Volucribacter psittacicida]
MNKVFKVIWSRAFQQFIVTSELGKGCIKSSCHSDHHTDQPNKQIKRIFHLSAIALLLTSFQVQAAVQIGSTETDSVKTSGATAAGENAIAIGAESNAPTQGSISIGQGAGKGSKNATETGLISNISIGTSAGQNLGEVAKDNVALGRAAGTNVLGENNIAIGSGANPGYYDRRTEAVFSATDAQKAGKTVITKEQLSGNIAIGDQAKSRGNYATAIGGDALSVGSQSTAFGSGSRAFGGETTALGAYSVAAKTRAIAIGQDASAYNDDSLAIMNSALSMGTRAIAIGQSSQANANDTLALGTGAKVLSTGATVTFADGATGNTTAIKKASQKVSSVDRSIDSMAIGNSAQITDSKQAIAMGKSATVNKAANNAIAMGNTATVDKADGIAIGNNAKASQANSIALGANSETSDAVGTSQATVNGISYSGFSGSNPNSTLSIGKTGVERTITNVAAGRISATSTDAINGSQLYLVANALGNVANSTTTILGGNATVGTDGTITMSNIGNTGKNNVHEAIAAAKTEVKAGTNIQSVTSEIGTNGQTIYTVNAKGAAVEAGSDISITSSSQNNITTYTVALAEATKKTITDTANQATTNANNITALQGDVANNKTNISQLQTEVTNHTQNINKNSENITALQQGWNIGNHSGEKVKAITAGNQVNFVNGTGTTANVQASGNNANVSFDVNTATLSAKDGVVSSDKTGNNFATASNVAEMINQANTSLSNKGTVYSGDVASETNNTFTQALGAETKIIGGQTDKTKLSDNNIGVVSNGTDTLTIKLAKDLVDLTSANFVDGAGNETSITAAATTMTDANQLMAIRSAERTLFIDPNSSKDPVSLSAEGLDNGGNKITKVAAGTADTDAVNVKQLNELANKDLTFAGDTGTDVKRKLGETLKIAGGADSNLTDNNIGVVADGNQLTVKLSENLAGLSSAGFEDNLGNSLDITGNQIYLSDGNIDTSSLYTREGISFMSNGQETVSLTNQGLNNGGNKITNVAAGTADTDAVNYGQLKEIKTAAETAANRTNYFHVNTGEANQAAGDATTNAGSVDAKGGATGKKALAAGVNAQAAGENGISVGYGAGVNSTGSNNIALGVSAGQNISGNDNVSIGNRANYNRGNVKRTVAIGSGAMAYNDFDIALGAGSQTEPLDTDTGFPDPVENATINGLNYDFNSGTWVSGTLSLGNSNGDSSFNSRRITNVAAGRVTATSTDAVNGSQLFALANTLGNVANDTVSILGGNAEVATDGSITMSNIGGTGKDTVDEAIAAAKTEVKAGTNIQSVTAEAGTNGQTIYTVNAKGAAVQAGSDITVSSQTDSNNVTTYTVSLSADTKQMITDTATKANTNATDIVNLKTDVANNKADIATNKADIATNKADIATNKANIATNKADIATNKADIATNKADIATNKADIASNKVDIATNKADIATNKADIASNKADIATNKADIAINKADIATNKADIATNKADIATNKADIAINKADIATNKADIATNKADIAANKADIATNKADIATNKADIATNKADIATNKADIASNKADIATNKADIASNKADVATNKADIATNKADIATNKATIEKGTVYSGDVQDSNASSNKFTQALGNETKIIGGQADKTKLSDNNIGVVSNGSDTLTVKLAKDLTGLTSVSANTFKAGSTTITNNSITMGSGANAVSLTDTGLNNGNNKITGVKAGDISATSTDAVNGRQLNKVYNFSDDMITLLGGNAAMNEEGNIAMSNIGGTGYDNINDAVAAATTKVTQGDNIEVTTISNTDGSKTYRVATAKDVSFTSVTVGNVAINESGINAGNKKITNIAPGELSENSTDAVNGSQLHATNQQVIRNAQAINQLAGHIDQVDRDLRGGIAGAMAMSGLYQATHPGKSMVSAGVGAYKGQSAIAVGYSRLSDNGKLGVKFSVNSNTRGDSGVAASIGYQW